MPDVDRNFPGWPFLENRHRVPADRLEACCAGLRVAHGDVDAACRDLAARLGADGWPQHGADPLDVRTLCLIRETLARHVGLADFAFAMQSLSAGPITLFGSTDQRCWFARTRSGAAIAAFALGEPRPGSDVAAMKMTARR